MSTRVFQKAAPWFIGIYATMLFASIGIAGELPLWEAGIGASGLTISDYRGSNQQGFYALPIPYLIYRGDVFRVDRKGVYGLLFESERVHLNISASGGVPVKSSNNTARTGMEDLNPTFQIGPKLVVCLLRDCRADTTVRFQLPVRFAFAVATDFSQAKAIGTVIEPQLNFDFRNFPAKGWNSGFTIGPLFATQEYHQYYYEVPYYYAVPGFRAPYRSKGGYSGTQLIFGTTKRFDNFWFGAFAGYDELSGAVFDNSPLMRTKQSFMAGIGFAWVFAKSKTMVKSVE